MARPQCGDKRLRIVGANGSARYIGQKYAVWDGRPARHPNFIARPMPVEAVRG